MKWTIDQQPENGIMFRGQSTVRVINRRGETGIASVQYYPACAVVGPVRELVPTDRHGYPTREAEIMDSRPTFES